MIALANGGLGDELGVLDVDHCAQLALGVNRKRPSVPSRY